MKQWEYKFDNILETGPLEVSAEKPLNRDRWYEEQLQRLNDLGAAGWELVAVFFQEPYKKGDMLLKREKLQQG